MLKKFTSKKQKYIIYGKGVPTMCNPIPKECPEELRPIVEEIKMKTGELTRVQTQNLVKKLRHQQNNPPASK